MHYWTLDGGWDTSNSRITPSPAPAALNVGVGNTSTVLPRRARLAFLLEHQEKLHHLIHATFLLPLVTQVKTAHLQVFLYGQMGEDPPALRHK